MQVAPFRQSRDRADKSGDQFSEMNKRVIVTYWLLLLVPTIVIGAFGFRLLQHEQERILEQAERTMQGRLEVAAERLAVDMASVRQQVEGGLGQLAGGYGASVFRLYRGRGRLHQADSRPGRC